MPAYLGGLLLSLGAMIAIFQAKRAMMPNFHLVHEERDTVTIPPGGGIRVVYNEEPGHFLIPGLPTGVTVTQKQPDGNFTPVMRLQYGALVEKEPLIGPFVEEGKYNVDADFYICAQPGVADCTKLTLSQDVHVERNAPSRESRLEIDLPKLARVGLDAGAAAEKR